MKTYALLILASLAGLLTAGALYWREVNVSRLEGSFEEQIAGLRGSFLAQHQPTAIIDQRLTTGERAELVDPATSLPRLHAYPFDNIKALNDYATTCATKSAAAVVSPSLQKAKLWHQWRCGHKEALPPKFFMSPPFMHPNGSSFVLLSYQAGPAVYSSESWFEKHKHQLHVSELKNFPGLKLAPAPSLLSTLPRPALHAVVQSEPYAMSSQSILLLVQGANEFSSAAYHAFPLKAWEEFTKDFPWHLQARQGKACTYGSGSYCWREKPVSSPSSTTLYALLALISIGVLAATLVALIFQRLLAMRRDRREQQFILRTLTHELRTPATSMNLALEPLRRDFDHLNDNCQAAFLRLCDDLQRLNRTIAASSRYLRVQGLRAKDRFQYRSIESLNEFTASTLAPYENALASVTLLTKDRSLHSDPFWIGICLVNLIENAIRHGKPPLRVRLRETAAWIFFDVEDGGLISQDLRQLTRPFSREDASHGLGLGLSIVSQTLTDLGGALELTKSPSTCFTIKIPTTNALGGQL